MDTFLFRINGISVSFNTEKALPKYPNSSLGFRTKQTWVVTSGESLGFTIRDPVGQEVVNRF